MAVRTAVRPIAGPVTGPGRAVPGPGLLQQAATQLARARTGLMESALATSAAERYVAAHLAALRAAAAVLAARARPATRRGAPPSVWTMLATVAPELNEWAMFFAASAGRRADAEAGIPGAVGAREADDLLRDAETFLALVETTLGLASQQSLPRVHAALRAG
jgi:hypothetical protein